MKKEIIEYMMAVNFLIGDLEYMMEDMDFDEDRLIKRINVVNKFKLELENLL